MTKVLQELNKNHYRTLKELADKVNLVLLENQFNTPEELEKRLYDFKLRPVPKGNNGVIRWLDTDNYGSRHTYTIAINRYSSDYDSTKHYWKILRSMTEIDGETVSLDWINLQLETDLVGIKQKKWLEVFSLEPLEVLIYHLLGINVKFEKDIYEKDGNWKMRFSSTENLIEYAGICKWIMKDLRIDSFGSCSFYFDRDSGEQKLSLPPMHFYYEHTNGGSNDYELIRVYYDMYSGNWHYLKDGVAIIFYNANNDEYQNMSQQV